MGRTGALKGNLVVGQAGGPTAVINSSLAGVIQEARRHQAIAGIYGAAHGIEGVLKEEFYDLGREPLATVKALRRTPSAILGSCRRKLTTAEYERVLSVFRAHNVRYFIYIGGNDSADTAHQVSALARDRGYELRVMGVPKTIDNDLPFMDHTPGYGSAARFLAVATMDAGRDSEAMRTVDKVKILEVMGRNAGWLAAATALGRRTLGDAPHLIYFPEKPLVEEHFLSDISAVYREHGYAVAVVASGVRGPSGQELVATGGAMFTDSFGHRQLGGVGQHLTQLVVDNLGLKARYEKPGSIQRMFISCVSSVDAREAYLVGKMAVRRAVQGGDDAMVTILREPGTEYRISIGQCPLSAIANAERRMPPEYINETGNHVTAAFVSYALPLIGGPLPEYARLGGWRVAKRLA
jgi:6-phosphofructokinase 1